MTPAGSTQGASRVGALAVVVSAGASPFLAQTLSAITSQTCAPDVVLVVDVASRANGLGDGTPIEELVQRSGLDAVTAVRVVRAKEAKNFGDAVSRGLTAYAGLVAAGNRKRRSSEALDGAEGSDADTTSSGPRTSVRDLLLSGSGPITGPTGALSPITAYEQRLVAPTEATPEMPEHQVWFWLLHDDSAPAEDCLERLLTAATNARSVGIVGPKQVGWDNPELLLEVGLRATASARRANDIVPGEVDQGQHDDRSDVLAVGTAGPCGRRSAASPRGSAPSATAWSSRAPRAWPDTASSSNPLPSSATDGPPTRGFVAPHPSPTPPTRRPAPMPRPSRSPFPSPTRSGPSGLGVAPSSPTGRPSPPVPSVCCSPGSSSSD